MADHDVAETGGTGFPSVALVARAEPIAREALEQITDRATIGELLETEDEGERVFTLRFASLLSGYPGWRWAVSLAALDGQPVTVLETELTPGEDALLAPDWVPWAERLAEWEAAQAALAGEPGDTADSDHLHDEEDDEHEDDDDVDVDDDDDDDDDFIEGDFADEFGLDRDLDDHLDDDLVQDGLDEPDGQDELDEPDEPDEPDEQDAGAAADPRDSTVPVVTDAVPVATESVPAGAAVPAVGVDQPDQAERDPGSAGRQQQVARRRSKHPRQQDAEHEGGDPEH